MKHLSYTSGIYYEIKRERARLHPEAETTPDAQSFKPLDGWTSHIDEVSGKTFFHHKATNVSEWDLPAGAVLDSSDSEPRIKRWEKKFGLRGIIMGSPTS